MKDYLSFISLLVEQTNINNFGLPLMTRQYDGSFGSGVLNPGAVLLRFVTEAFLLFLAPAGPIF